MYKALFSRKTIDKIPEYYDCVHDLLNTSAVQELGEYTHHKGTTRLQHSLNVSYYNFLLCRKLHFDAAPPRGRGFCTTCSSTTGSSTNRWMARETTP